MNKIKVIFWNMVVSGNLSARTCKRNILKKIKPYGDTDVTLQFKTHDQNLQVSLKWDTKIMLKQLFSHQNKRKIFKTFGNKILSPRNKDRKFLNLTFFSFAPTLSPYIPVSYWNFPKLGNDFKCLMHTDMLK